MKRAASQLTLFGHEYFPSLLLTGVFLRDGVQPYIPDHGVHHRLYSGVTPLDVAW